MVFPRASQQENLTQSRFKLDKILTPLAQIVETQGPKLSALRKTCGKLGPCQIPSSLTNSAAGERFGMTLRLFSFGCRFKEKLVFLRQFRHQGSKLKPHR